jgi:hypothetical protein
MGRRIGDEWTAAARTRMLKQGRVALCEAQLGLLKANAEQAGVQPPPGKKRRRRPTTNQRRRRWKRSAKNWRLRPRKTAEAAVAVAKATEQTKSDPTTAYKPRPKEDYPTVSTGRRLAFARWIANADNPLTARVAMNHLWLRHFGRGIIATPEKTWAATAPARSHLPYWIGLPLKFMANGWQMKPMHRMIVTSNTTECRRNRTNRTRRSTRTISIFGA